MSPVLPYGRQQLMVMAAFRYCVGRTSYIVSDCADWLVELWPTLSNGTRAVIKRDLEDDFRRDDEQRARGEGHRALGDECDREQWLRVRALWA